MVSTAPRSGRDHRTSNAGHGIPDGEEVAATDARSVGPGLWGGEAPWGPLEADSPPNGGIPGGRRILSVPAQPVY